MHPWQLHCLTIVTLQLQLPVRRKFRSIWSNIVGISNPTPTISTSRSPCSSSTSVGEYSSDIRLRVCPILELLISSWHSLLRSHVLLLNLSRMIKSSAVAFQVSRHIGSVTRQSASPLLRLSAAGRLRSNALIVHVDFKFPITRPGVCGRLGALGSIVSVMSGRTTWMYNAQALLSQIDFHLFFKLRS
jgi:hypothetical protein